MDNQTNEVELQAGVFEREEKGGGYLRSAKHNYKRRPNDPFLPVRLGQKFVLRGGEVVAGNVEKSKGRGGPRQRLADIVSINECPAEEYLDVTPLEDLTAIDPEQQMHFEIPGGSPSMRIVDLLTPIGFGQRGLIVAPPRTGKTVLLQQMAEGIATNHPETYLMVLLIDERPEEVTEMRRKVRGEVIASSNDEDVASHVRIARLMIQKAKRLVEYKRDVVILLDSLTRLGRAFNAAIRHSGRIMSGGLDIRALTEPKSIFGAARKVEEGGSLTVLASSLIETGSRMDEVIFNEFKGTGNMEIMLSRSMADRRIWPAIDLHASGTRKEDKLLTPEALELSYRIRRTIIDRDPLRSMEQLLEAMGKFESNEAFIKTQQQSSGAFSL